MCIVDFVKSKIFKDNVGKFLQELGVGREKLINRFCAQIHSVRNKLKHMKQAIKYVIHLTISR